MAIDRDIQEAIRNVEQFDDAPGVVIQEMDGALPLAEALIDAIKEKQQRGREEREAAQAIDVSGRTDDQLRAEFNAIAAELRARGRPLPGGGRGNAP